MEMTASRGPVIGQLLREWRRFGAVRPRDRRGGVVLLVVIQDEGSLERKVKMGPKWVRRGTYCLGEDFHPLVGARGKLRNISDLREQPRWSSTPHTSSLCGLEQQKMSPKNVKMGPQMGQERHIWP